MSDLLCSVIVPSYNRRDTLEMVLEGLAAQTLPADSFEVIAVLDGSTDDSPQMLKAWQQSRRIANLRWHRQQNSGVATARNTGVNLAKGPVVIFLDDDVVPSPDVLERHVAHHAAGERIAVLGDCNMVIENRRSLYQNYIWAWWEDHYHRRSQPGRVASYRDFTTGHVSLRRDEFLRLGGFDTGFKGYNTEDYELGYRLLKAGIRFVPDRQLRAQHYHRTPVAGNILRGSRNEGRGDVHLGEKHPELRHSLRLMHVPEGSYGRLTRLAMDAPARGDSQAAMNLRLMSIYERLGMRHRWVLLFYHLRNYAYWCGVRDVLGGWEQLHAYQQQVHQHDEVCLDISVGLPVKLPTFNLDATGVMTVTCRGRRLGKLYLSAVNDCLSHESLAQALLDQLGFQYVVALAEISMTQRAPHPSNSIHGAHNPIHAPFATMSNGSHATEK